MRRLLTGLLLLGLAVPALAADDKKPADAKPTKSAEEFQALKKEYDAAQKKFSEQIKGLRKQFTEAKDDEDKQKEIKKKFSELIQENPGAKFGPRFFELAEKNAKGPSAIDALKLALQNSGGPKGKDGIWGKSVTLLNEQDFVKVPQVKRLLPMLAYSDDEAARKFVRGVLEKNSDRVTKARAAQAFANVAEDAFDSASRLQENKELRDVEKQRGKEAVQKIIDKGEKARGELRELEQVIRTKFADIVPDLSVGKKAPEIAGRDLDGKKVKLSDLKGKVVVLDVWATWCGPCRAMIPHEVAMVKKLKDKPFVLVSISADDEPATVKEFLGKTPMPWTHWYNGPEGGLVEEWNVRYYPTVYVLDAKGVIRLDAKGFGKFEDRGEELEALVGKLLKEAEDKKGTD